MFIYLSSTCKKYNAADVFVAKDKIASILYNKMKKKQGSVYYIKIETTEGKYLEIHETENQCKERIKEIFMQLGCATDALYSAVDNFNWEAVDVDVDEEDETNDDVLKKALMRKLLG